MKHKCCDIRIHTSGELLTPEVNRELVDCGINLIWISLEGLSSEGYKQICEAKIDFDQLVDSIQDLLIKAGEICSISENCKYVNKDKGRCRSVL